MSNTFILNDEEQPRFDGVIGISAKIKQAINLAKKAALHSSPVLITGEKGTGKKFFAEAISRASYHNAGEFIIFNCKHSSEEALDTILHKNPSAVFTLFLENAEMLPVHLQKKILQFLKTVRLSKSKNTHMRLIGAARSDLKQLVREEKFSKELYHKFHRFNIYLPPLRERKEDIPEIAECFLRYFAHKTGRKSLLISTPAMKMLTDYTWKGNIKELKNVIERAVVLEEKNVIDTNSLPFELNTRITSFLSLYDLDVVAKKDIQKVLKYTHGNKHETARLLNIGLGILHKKMDEYLIGQ